MNGAETLKADPVEIRCALDLICEDGAVYELRALGTAKGTVSGYFDDFETLAENAAGCSDRLQADGVYLTLNPVRRDLLARASNRLEAYARHTSADVDMIARRWLPLDFDPVRPAGISSTDAEHEAALGRAMTAREMLAGLGWPAAVFADSGNGAHLLYRIGLPNDDASRELLRRVLASLDSLFSDEMVAVDKTTFNTARIWKVYGSVARKGDSTPDRLHRLARILDASEVPRIVSPEQLDKIAGMLPKPEPPVKSNPTTQASFSLESWIAKHGIEVTRESTWNGGRRWILSHCLFDLSHGGSGAAILQLSSGAIAYRCLHNSCADRKWTDVREFFEPGYRDRRADSSATVLPEVKPSASCIAHPSVFKNAPTVPEFLAQSDGTDGALYAGGLLLVRSGASLLASPRGLGKTIVAMNLAIAAANGGDFCGEVLPKSRVLYCAYENSPAVLRDRLRRLGGAESENLRILTRSKAPKLQSEDWRAFPVEDYDFIIIDSLSPALEGGIDERQGGQNSDALAALLDIVQRGPGALLIANTTKTASSIRGSGILTDRADLVFEVRDATDFKPHPKHEVWWDGLVENQGESGWAGRAKRRRGKTIFRLALIASKMRVGPELDPRVLELSLPADEPWTVTDVTTDVSGTHARLKSEAVEKRQAREDYRRRCAQYSAPDPEG